MVYWYRLVVNTTHFPHAVIYLFTFPVYYIYVRTFCDFYLISCTRTVTHAMPLLDQNPGDATAGMSCSVEWLERIAEGIVILLLLLLLLLLYCISTKQSMNKWWEAQRTLPPGPIHECNGIIQELLAVYSENTIFKLHENKSPSLQTQEAKNSTTATVCGAR